MLKRYSRLIVLFAVCFACVAVNVWLIMMGHYRLPLLVFVLCLVGAPLILRKLPPVIKGRQEIRINQLRAASAARRLGWIYVAGLVLGSLNLISGGAKDMPFLAVVIAIGWSVFLIWGCFWMAKRFKQAAAKTEKPSD